MILWTLEGFDLCFSVLCDLQPLVLFRPIPIAETATLLRRSQ